MQIIMQLILDTKTVEFINIFKTYCNRLYAKLKFRKSSWKSLLCFINCINTITAEVNPVHSLLVDSSKNILISLAKERLCFIFRSLVNGNLSLFVPLYLIGSLYLITLFRDSQNRFFDRIPRMLRDQLFRQKVEVRKSLKKRRLWSPQRNYTQCAMAYNNKAIMSHTRH